MKNLLLTLSLFLWIFVGSVALSSCADSPKERQEPSSPAEVALAEKQLEERIASQIEAKKNNPPIGKIKVITDDLGCQWIVLTAASGRYYHDQSVAVDIEHHPKCTNH